MTTFQDLTNFVLTFATSLLAIFATVWGWFRWTLRPQLVCGIPPSWEEQQDNSKLRTRLGSLSPAGSFQHRPDCLAEPLAKPWTKPWAKREVNSERGRAHFFDDPLRCRRVTLSADRFTTIAVVLENSGGRMAKDYSASIAFLPEFDGRPIQLLDVHSERGLDVASIYTADARELRPELQDRAAPPEIVAAYDDYLQHVPEWGDAVFLTGSLEAKMIDLVTLRIRVPAEATRFLVVYTLECSDGWTQAVKYIQGCRLVPHAAGAAKPIK